MLLLCYAIHTLLQVTLLLLCAFPFVANAQIVANAQMAYDNRSSEGKTILACSLLGRCFYFSFCCSRNFYYTFAKVVVLRAQLSHCYMKVCLSNQTKNRERYITSLVAAGYLQMTNPDNPTASNQKYKKVNKR